MSEQSDDYRQAVRGECGHDFECVPGHHCPVCNNIVALRLKPTRVEHTHHCPNCEAMAKRLEQAMVVVRSVADLDPNWHRQVRLARKIVEEEG